MASWTRVTWTEAGQVAARLGWDEDLGADGRLPPADFLRRLRQNGRRHEAVSFLGQALPRFETVAWAAGVVRDLTPRGGGGSAADPLKASLLWLQDPSDTRRRAASEAAKTAPMKSAARLLAQAVFYSGGSIAPPDCAALPPPPEAAGRFAAAAILLACLAAPDEVAAMDRALDAGEAIAGQGKTGA